MKLWGGRFQEETAPEVEAFTASIPFDKKLYREDIAGSIAHVQMLAANGIISEDDAAQIKDGLLKILGRINSEGQTILMVTHSVKAASHAGRVLFIKDGEVFHQIYRGGKNSEELYQNIADTLTVIATGGERR